MVMTTIKPRPRLRGELKEAEIEGESPNLFDEELAEVNESPIPIPDSARYICASSSSVELNDLSIALFFLGRGGNCLLLFTPAKLSSQVGDPLAEGGSGIDRFVERLLECTSTIGGSFMILPGHGMAIETSLHWKCS